MNMIVPHIRTTPTIETTVTKASAMQNDFCQLQVSDAIVGLLIAAFPCCSRLIYSSSVIPVGQSGRYSMAMMPAVPVANHMATNSATAHQLRGFIVFISLY